jgi:hypothetical protein
VAVGQQTESIVEKLKVKAPVFKGQPNAFAIQLFCMDEKYEMRSVDMLPAVFELFPVCTASHDSQMDRQTDRQTDILCFYH